ncbi:hypothetical protein PsYK624_003600 [Phanerochaete sordida]|uniref:Uncharacterized protein n=1 Tax=Phanerochaete sordida TaxID=48140 RepID=A0A9P3FXT2_9APHY|nr:hypothetical protein PsYK624_003600 [Phanerochaete sordida]
MSTEDLPEAAIALEASVFTPKDIISTWPFDENDNNFARVDIFVKNLYLGDGDGKPWMNNTKARESETWMVQRIGNANLTPVTNEPVASEKNPSYQWAEIWRALNTYNVLTTRHADSPVTNLLFQLPASGLAQGMFPANLRTLLTSNEATIRANPQSDWIGRPPPTAPNPPVDRYAPFAGVQAAYATGMQFFQTGAVGPTSVEAAFVLATQFAGVNWQKLQRRLGTPGAVERGVFWVAALLVDKASGEYVITERRRHPLGDRNQGLRYYLRNASQANDPQAGMVLVLDLDPDIDGFRDARKKVFLFVIHAIDAHSRVFVPPVTALTNLAYTTYNPATSAPPLSNLTSKDNIRFYGHAHAAIMDYNAWMDWFGQKNPGEPMPRYAQIGEQHFYFLVEDENDLWPRRKYLATGSK